MGTHAAAFFDLDKTILAKSATLVLFRPLLDAGLISRTDVARNAHAQLSYHFLHADHERSERVRTQLSALVAGWDVHTFDEVVRESLATRIEPEVFGEALTAIATHRAAGHAIVICSASAAAIVNPIAQMLGATHTIASVLTEKDGHYTGEISSYAYGPEKAQQIAHLAACQGWDLDQCWAYSDSITDVPMLTLVGHPVAVNPDRALRQIAIDQGWQVQHFTIEVPLSARRALPAVTGVGLAVIAVSLWWWRRRRA